MIAKLKLALGCVLIVVLASAGLTMHVMSHSFDRVRSVVMPFERQAKEVYVGDEFPCRRRTTTCPYTTGIRRGSAGPKGCRRRTARSVLTFTATTLPI